MFTSNPIKSRVMEAINTKIKEADLTYRNGCIDIDQEAESKKAALADTLVSDLLGKIL